MELKTWNYFLALEKDFLSTTDYVEINSANYSTYSNFYARLLLLVGSEVDVVAKQLCADLDSDRDPNNINQYQDIITSKFNGMHECEVNIPRYSLKIKPWASWGTPSTRPDW